MLISIYVSAQPPKQTVAAFELGTGSAALLLKSLSDQERLPDSHRSRQRLLWRLRPTGACQSVVRIKIVEVIWFRSRRNLSAKVMIIIVRAAIDGYDFNRPLQSSTFDTLWSNRRERLCLWLGLWNSWERLSGGSEPAGIRRKGLWILVDKVTRFRSGPNLSPEIIFMREEPVFMASLPRISEVMLDLEQR